MNLNLALLFPEWVAIGTFVLLLFTEILKGKPTAETESKISFGWIPVALLSFLAVLPYQGKIGSAFEGMFILDSFALFFKAFFALVFFVIVWMSRDYFAGRKEKAGAYLLILWSVLIGLFFLASANHFLVMFVSLEIVTMSFYVLTAYQKNEMKSIESGIKYLIIGSLASAFMIFGIALLYIGAGSLAFTGVREAYSAAPGNFYLNFGLLFILAGLGFKVGALPFQLWVPDVYQGAPVPVVGFLSIASKAAGLVLLIRVLFNVFVDFEAQRLALFSALAVLTLLYGNLGALKQTNIKRLFGYSSIGHAGYLLMAVAVGSLQSITALIYYLMAYAVTNLAAFYVITMVSREIKSDEIIAYTGLGKRSPFLAASLFVALLSLAGIPPLAGFFGKFLILFSLAESGQLVLATVGVLGVPISLYYYLSVIKTMYVEQSTHDQDIVSVSVSTKWVLGVLVAGIFILGLWQAPFYTWAERAAVVLF